MERITVYRSQMIEDSIYGLYGMRDGKYVSRAAKDMAYGDSNFDRFPLPVEDPKLLDHRGTKMFYGFKNINQLKYWVYKKEWRTLLYEDAFEIRVYKALGVHGAHQSVFWKKNMIGRKYKIGLDLL
jgi:hypothetical protein